MSTNPQLAIYEFHPPDMTDGNDLISLFFRLRDTGNGYRLHLSDGTKIKTDPHHIQIGVPFTFQYDGLFWTLTLVKVWTDSDGTEKASGSWSAGGGNKGGHGEGEGDPESGTFQAQAGGHPIGVGRKASA